MNSLLSLFLCFAMLFSGAYGAEVPTDPHAASATISDIVLTVNGTDYAIDPTAVLAVETAENSLTLDARVQAGDRVLLPVQARMDESGLAFTAGSSKVTYVFTPELLEAQIGNALTGHVELLSALAGCAGSNTDRQQLLPALRSVIADPQEADTTILLDGESLQARSYTGSLDLAGLLRVYDTVLATESPELHAASLHLIHTLLTAMDEERAAALPEKLEHLEELAPILASDPTSPDIRAELTVCLTEDGRGTAQLVRHSTDDGQELTLPVELTVLGPDRAGVSCALRLSGFSMNASASVDGSAYQIDFSYDVEDEGSFGFYITGSHGAAGNAGLTITDETMYTTVSLSAEWNGAGVTDVHTEIATGEDLYTLSFRITTAECAVADRLKDNEQVVFERPDDDGLDGMYYDLGTALTDDLMALEAEESVQAAIAAYTGADMIGDTPQQTEHDPDYGADPSALPFTLPQLTRLPEDYTAREPVIYADDWSTCVTYDIDYTGSSTAYHSSLSLMLYKSSDTSVAWYAADGSPMESAPITVTRTEGFTEATMVTPDSVQVTLDCYDASIEDAVLVDILTGLVF